MPFPLFSPVTEQQMCVLIGVMDVSNSNSEKKERTKGVGRRFENNALLFFLSVSASAGIFFFFDGNRHNKARTHKKINHNTVFRRRERTSGEATE
jgi:hypothetical protein